jgi:hypothetical protein
LSAPPILYLMSDGLGLSLDRDERRRRARVRPHASVEGVDLRE